VPHEIQSKGEIEHMTQMRNAQSVALQLEKVRDKLPLLYERDDILLTMIQQRGDVERVSSRNMRLPLPADGAYTSLSPAACDWIVRAVEWAKRQPRRDQGGAIAAREARRARDWDRDGDALLDDAVPAFHGCHL
jgi:hypothetical protein